MTNSEKFPLDAEVKINYPAGKVTVADWEETLALLNGLHYAKVSLRTDDGQFFILDQEWVKLVDQPKKTRDYVARDLWQDENGEVWQYDLHHDVYYNLSRATPQRTFTGSSWKRMYAALED